MKYLDADKTVLHDAPVYLEGKRDDVIFKAAFQYTDGYTENIFSYANNIPTGEGALMKRASRLPSPRLSMIMPGKSAR